MTATSDVVTYRACGTLRFAALDFAFEVRSTSTRFASLVESVFGECHAPAGASSASAVYEAHTADDGRLTVTCDGEHTVTTPSLRFALDYLVWHVNQRVIAASGARVLLHAAMAAREGAAVVIPASSGGGKSTLVAALTRAGWEYATDEVVAIDASSGCLFFYGKAIGLKEGSWPLFSWGDDPIEVTADYTTPTRYMRAGDLGSVHCGCPAQPSLLVVPARGGATGTVTTLRRAEALMMLVDQCFNFETYGRGALTALGELVRDCRCVRVDTSDLSAAVDAITRLLADVRGTP
jgi:hypothetical protein